MLAIALGEKILTTYTRYENLANILEILEFINLNAMFHKLSRFP